jgi:O-antigen ligase
LSLIIAKSYKENQVLPKNKRPYDKKIKAQQKGNTHKASPENTIKKAALSQAADHRSHYLLLLILIVLSLILIIGPFYRGLFFPRELIVANGLVFMLLIIWGIYRIVIKKNTLFSSPVEICLTLLILAYVVSFFVAVNKRDALTEILKYSSYFILLLMAIDIGFYFRLPWRYFESDNQELREHEGAKILIYITIISSVLLSFTSLAIAAGLFSIPDAYVGYRIASPIVYANTAALYFMAGYLSLIAFIPTFKKFAGAIHLGLATVLLITVILTYSRGAWLLLPPLCLLLIIASQPGERLRASLNLLATAIPAVIVAFYSDSMFRSSNSIMAWVALLFAYILTIFFALLIDKFIILDRTVRKKILIAGISAAGSALIGVLIFILLMPIILHHENGNSNNSQLHQVIENVIPNENYRLEFEPLSITGQQVAADTEARWRVLVRAGFSDYSYQDLADQRGVAVDTSERQYITFSTPNDLKRLEILLFNESPGSKIEIKSVILSTETTKTNLRFLAYRLIPQSFYERIYSFSRDVNMDRRFELFSDALKVIKDYPVLGIGGGGWAAVYKGYIDNDYNSRQVHNQYLQVWIESGILGFLAFIGIWISFTIVFIKNRIKPQTTFLVKQLWVAAYIPVIAIGLHSIIDWHFAMASVGYYLFVLIGAGLSINQVNWFHSNGRKHQNKKVNWLGLLSIIVGLSLLAFTFTLFFGLHASWRSQELVEQLNYKAAMKEFEKAISLDPLRAENYYNMSVIIEDQALQTRNPETMQQVIALAQKAYELEPFNLRYVLRYGQLLLHYVDIEQGLSYLDLATELNPFSLETYLFVIFSRINTAEHLISNGANAEAERLLLVVFDLEQAMAAKDLFSRDIFFALGRTNELLGNYELALDCYEKVGVEDNYYQYALEYSALLKEKLQTTDN